MEPSTATTKRFSLGQSFAFAHFHGFLKLLLASPSEGKGFKDRLQKFQADHKIEFAVEKLVILVPTFPFFVSDFEAAAPGRCERVGVLDTVLVSRAGMKERPYTCHVYRLKCTTSQDPVYVVLDMPAVLLTLYELCTSQTRVLAYEELDIEINSFSKTLSKLLTDEPASCDAFTVILYHDKDEEGRNVDLVDFICKQLTCPSTK